MTKEKSEIRCKPRSSEIDRKSLKKKYNLIHEGKVQSLKTAMKENEFMKAKDNFKKRKLNDEKLKCLTKKDDIDSITLDSSFRPKSTLQQKYRTQLAGSRFRELNEDLYTMDSMTAFERFQGNPNLFRQYHTGFRTQVKSWPINPVHSVYKWIISVHKKRKVEGNNSKLVVADFGCGDAKLAQRLLDFNESSKKLRMIKNNKNDTVRKSKSSPFIVHSFDLVANGNPNITPCDMANVPIPDGVVDIGVFVLALMGTNITDFIREAYRVLTPNGKLKIAEVRSRFERSSDTQNKLMKSEGINSSIKDSDDTLLIEFIDVMNKLGFRCTEKDRKNKMFLLLEFEKTQTSPCRDAKFTAKPFDEIKEEPGLKLKSVRDLD